jgi:hypothetical protein
MTVTILKSSCSRFLDRPRPGNRLGSLRLCLSTTWADDLGILVGQLVQEGGERRVTVRA